MRRRAAIASITPYTGRGSPDGNSAYSPIAIFNSNVAISSSRPRRSACADQASCTCATSNMHFAFCDADAEYGSCWSSLIASKLIALAEVHNCHGWLFVDEGGRFFGASQVHDAFYFDGNNFAEAAERLLLGQRARPMLKPDQDEIYLYGEKFTRGHPAVFDY